MRKTLPTVKPLIEALQLADVPVRRRFRVVGACPSLGPSRTEDLGLPDWAQSRAAPCRLVRLRCTQVPPCCSHRSLEVLRTPHPDPRPSARRLAPPITLYLL